MDLRTALVAALRADATFASVMGTSASTAHVEGGDQLDSFLQGQTGHAFCRVMGDDTLESYAESEHTRFRFEVIIKLTDGRGASNALSVAKAGLKNVLLHRGATIFTTYFTDTNSNRLGKSGAWGLEDIDLVPANQLADPDRPEIRAVVACEMWHVMPLVST